MGSWMRYSQGQDYMGDVGKRSRTTPVGTICPHSILSQVAFEFLGRLLGTVQSCGLSHSKTMCCLGVTADHITEWHWQCAKAAS